MDSGRPVRSSDRCGGRVAARGDVDGPVEHLCIGCAAAFETTASREVREARMTYGVRVIAQRTIHGGTFEGGFSDGRKSSGSYRKHAQAALPLDPDTADR